MAATALLTSKTTNGAGTGVSVTGPCTVAFDGDCVFDGARCEIQTSLTDVDGKYATIGDGGVAIGPVPGNVSFTGAYYIRAKVFNAKTNTSISVSVNQ